MTKTTSFFTSFFLVSFLVCSWHFLGLACVITASIPRGIYQKTNEPIERGKLVAICLPLDTAVFGLKRGYLSLGVCSTGVQPVVKIIGAVEGDVVQVEKEGVAVNGRPYDDSAVADIDSNGRVLPHVLFGRHRVFHDEIWIFSFYDFRSWDSRYYGPVKTTQIISTMKAVWVWE